MRTYTTQRSIAAMELVRLAEKQKRVRYLRGVLTSMVQDLQIRAQLSHEIDELQALLVRCWESGSVSTAEMSLIDDTERKIEGLFEEARLRVVADPQAFRAS